MMLTDSQETLMRILAKTALIINDDDEKDKVFVEDGKALARDGLAKIGYDSERGLYAIKITEAGRAALASDGKRGGE